MEQAGLVLVPTPQAKDYLTDPLLQAMASVPGLNQPGLEGLKDE